MTAMEPPSKTPQPFVLAVPQTQRAPVVLTSPHSGRCYTDDFLAASRLSSLAIRRSEDSFVEELFESGPELGVPLLAAMFPRAYCDPNREAWELDPDMFEDTLPDHVNATSPRVSAGLGTIARIVATGETIYRRKLRFAEAEHRIASCWQPYHVALQTLIDTTSRAFGVCLVIDCHSMPKPSPSGQAAQSADIVLGDGYGTTCSPQITAFIETKLRRLGFTVRRNDPYAGGYITRHYGRPRYNVHVLQIELARSLYMDERMIKKSENFADLTVQLREFLASLIEVASFLLPAANNAYSLRGLPSAAE
jgi:N-formylglutamate amidohydrolase